MLDHDENSSTRSSSARMSPTPSIIGVIEPPVPVPAQPQPQQALDLILVEELEGGDIEDEFDDIEDDMEEEELTCDMCGEWVGGGGGHDCPFARCDRCGNINDGESEYDDEYEEEEEEERYFSDGGYHYYRCRHHHGNGHGYESEGYSDDEDDESEEEYDNEQEGPQYPGMYHGYQTYPIYL